MDDYKSSSYKDKDKHHHHRHSSGSRDRSRSKDRSHSREHKDRGREETREERRARKEREKAEKKRRESGGDDTSTSRGFDGSSYQDASAYQPATYQPAAPYPTTTGSSYEQHPGSGEHYSSGYNTSGGYGGGSSDFTGYPPPAPPPLEPSHHDYQSSSYTTSGAYGSTDTSGYPPVPPKSPHDQYSGEHSSAYPSTSDRAYGQQPYGSTADQSYSGGYPSHSPGHSAAPYPAPSPGHSTSAPYGAPADGYSQQYSQTSPPPGAFPQESSYQSTYQSTHSPQPASSYPPPQDSSSYQTGSYHSGSGDYSSSQPYPQTSSTSQYPQTSSYDTTSHSTSTYATGAVAGAAAAGYGASSSSYSSAPLPPASGGHIQNPDMSIYAHPAPHNPLGSNYHPRPEPNGPPPREQVPTMQFRPPTTLDASGGGKSHGAEAVPKPAKSFLSSFPAALQSSLSDIAKTLTNTTDASSHFHTHTGSQCTHPDHMRSQHRFNSFASVRRGNVAKWFVDGKDYCYAVSCALERARKSIWILDWWLSPELYLRRPPAQNENYRLDRMLQAAALRGVKVNIIVYKEVTQALTLSSAHTKHALEALHPNIAVIRHPDHLPDRISISSAVSNAVTSGNISLAALGNPLSSDKVTLYWAHHEKLCLIDGDIEGGGIAFMGGLDLCFGRWDTNEHKISDVHPEDMSQTVFIGQDYNNSRVMDFHTVDQWQQNKLDRTKYSRMGWSDIALCFTGPSVEDLKIHFVDRWNFIYTEKYAVRKDDRYKKLVLHEMAGDTMGFEGGAFTGAYDLKGTMKRIAGRLSGGSSKGSGGGGGGYGGYGGPPEDEAKPRAKQEAKQRRKDRDMDALAFGGDSDEDEDPRRRRRGESPPRQRGMEEEQGTSRGLFTGYGHRTSRGHGYDEQPLGVQCQILRSCSPWSNGTQTEHSIANAYYDIIANAKHFIYIENQFFITNTGTEGGIVKNKIGESIVNRIIRAHQANERFRIIVVMPSVPAFAGDLQNKEALGTRAIMEFQYDSICRGGKGTSIIERLTAKGINASDYIRFYNLRNYDRINMSSEFSQVKQSAGVTYESAQADLDHKIGAGWASDLTQGGEYQKWQQASHGQKGQGVWDSIAGCAMLGGGDVRDVPWAGDPATEIDAFVTEELYVHTKLLIADDRVVICGSANLNDRSQLGDHDSEIAICIEDPTPLGSRMNGRDYVASHFAATLRRHVFRKHLGLIPPQNLQVVDDNMIPVPAPNLYDFDSQEDRMVMDPLSDDFWNLWNGTAKVNTDCFAKVFRPVPYNPVLTWKDYDDYYGQYFQAKGTKEKPIPAKYEVGHVVKEDFSPGVEGVKQVKEILSKIRGNLVEMPLDFLKNEDIAKESAEFNLITYSIYT